MAEDSRSTTAIHSFVHCANPHSQLAIVPSIVLQVYRTDHEFQVSPRRRRDQAGVAAPRSIQLAQHRPRSRPRTTGASKFRTFARNIALFPHRGSGDELSFLSTELHRHFSLPLNQRARQFPRSVVGRVEAEVAQLGVSRHGRCFVVCASRSLRGAKKHRTAGIWGISVSMRVPARIPLVSMARALRSARRRA